MGQPSTITRPAATEPVQDAVIRLAADPTGPELTAVLDQLTELKTRAHLSPDENLAFQRTLYWLHYGDHEPSHALRQWLAATTYDYFDASVTLPAVESATWDDFVTELGRQQRERSPLHHPLFAHCYSDAADFDEFKVYLRHKWIIMLTFWRSLAEFGDRVQRHELDSCALIYENVYEELGSGDASEAHLTLHHRLLRHIDMDVTWDDEPEFAETYEYINFRMFCMRNPEMAWGLGSFYSQEATSLEYTIGHYHQLRRHGVSHEMAEIYHAHEEIDAEHTDEVLEVMARLVTTPEQRAVVLAAQDHQMRLWNAHFDRVHAQLGLEA